MIIIDLIFVCLYWQWWGGSGFQGWVGQEWEKVTGKGHHARNLAHRMGICPGLPRKGGLLLKKNWFGIKKEFCRKCWWKQSSSKKQQFCGRVGWVSSAHCTGSQSLEKKIEVLGNSGSLTFPAHRRKCPGELSPSSHTHHDSNSCSQEKGEVLVLFFVFPQCKLIRYKIKKTNPAKTVQSLGMGLAYFKHVHRLVCLATSLEILIFRPFWACTVLRGCQIDPKHKSKAFVWSKE